MNRFISRRHYAFVLIGLAVLSTITLRAQCPTDEAFPYYLCKDGEVVIRCTADPHHVWEDGKQLKPFKRYVPGCLTVERGRSFDIYMPAVGPGANEYVAVYLIGEESKDITEAFNQWNDLCPESQGEFDCCTKVFFSTNENDFTSRDAGISFSSTGTDTKTCRPTCEDEHRIYVNDSPTWLYSKERPDPRDSLIRSWYTGRYPPSIAYPYEAYSLHQAMEYATGSWYGLIGNPTSSTSGCEHPNSIMENPYTEDVPSDLTPDDVCQFRKLYCDHEVGLSVEDPTTPSIAFAIVPNPARSELTLRLPEDFPAAATLTLRIVDATGNTVQTTHLGEHAGEIPVDLSGIPNGVYVLTLSDGWRTCSEKIIVQR